MAEIDGELTFEPAASGERPERQFDRDWAHAILDRALVQLAAEFSEDAKAETWEVTQINTWCFTEVWVCFVHRATFLVTHVPENFRRG